MAHRSVMSDWRFQGRKLKSTRLRGRKGAAVVELALVLPILMAMLVGMIDLGLVIYEQMKLANAARAGAQYAFQTNCDTANHANIKKAVRDAWSGSVVGATLTLTPTPPTKFCKCASQSLESCESDCPLGDLQTYCKVRVEKTRALLFDFWDAFPGIANLSGQAILRLQ